MKKSSNPAPYLLSGLEQVSLVSLGNKNEVNDAGIIESGGRLCPVAYDFWSPTLWAYAGLQFLVHLGGGL